MTNCSSPDGPIHQGVALAQHFKALLLRYVLLYQTDTLTFCELHPRLLGRSAALGSRPEQGVRRLTVAISISSYGASFCSRKDHRTNQRTSSQGPLSSTCVKSLQQPALLCRVRERKVDRYVELPCPVCKLHRQADIKSMVWPPGPSLRPIMSHLSARTLRRC